MNDKMKELLVAVLSNTNAHKSLNVQDNRKNTCVHYAMYSHMSDVVKFLADCGADLTIENDEELSIVIKAVPMQAPISTGAITVSAYSTDIDLDDDTEDLPVAKVAPSNVFMKITEQPNAREEKLSEEKVDDRLNALVSAIAGNKDDKLDKTAMTDSTLSFVRDDLSSVHNKSPTKTIESQDRANTDTEQILEQIMSGFQTQNTSKQPSTTFAQFGGKGAQKRKMVTYSEVSLGGGITSDSENFGSISSSEFGGLQQLARAINNKADEYHSSSVNRIKEILELDEDEAKAVKAIIYNKIKEEQPGLSYLDRASELLKMSSDEKFLKKVKKTEISKMIKLIQDARARKAESDSEQNEKPKAAKESKSSKAPKASKAVKTAKASRAQSRIDISDASSSTSSDSVNVIRSRNDDMSDSSSTSSSTIFMSAPTYT